MEKEKPIGVFDSGIGGLTVVKRLGSILPCESIVYFGDTARVPYGSKSNATVIDYSIQDSNFLLHKNVKAVVVACNTASSIAIPELRKKFSIPVIGVILPGADMAYKETRNGSCLLYTSDAADERSSVDLGGRRMIKKKKKMIKKIFKKSYIIDKQTSA